MYSACTKATGEIQRVRVVWILERIESIAGLREALQKKFLNESNFFLVLRTHRLHSKKELSDAQYMKL